MGHAGCIHGNAGHAGSGCGQQPGFGLQQRILGQHTGFGLQIRGPGIMQRTRGLHTGRHTNSGRGQHIRGLQICFNTGRGQQTGSGCGQHVGAGAG